MNLNPDKIGVVIGRFQTDQPHMGHKFIIKEVLSRHNKVIVFIGTTPTCGTKENPLDYPTRELMIREAFPDVVVVPLPDFRSDQDWSDNVDKTIRSIFAIGGVCLYGSRDSFISHYKGNFNTCELSPLDSDMTSTDIREHLGSMVESSIDFRHGIIYASQNRYPIMYSTIDVAVLKGDTLENMEILMGTKYGDGELRLIGGFVDTHDPLESICRKEVAEEVNNIEISDPRYVNSYAIHDWRYRQSRDKIVSKLFHARYIHGEVKSTDDLDDIKWYNLSVVHANVDIGKTVVNSHRQMIKDLYNKLRGEYTE